MGNVQPAAWVEGNVGLPAWNTVTITILVKTAGAAEKSTQYQHLELTGKP